MSKGRTTEFEMTSSETPSERELWRDEFRHRQANMFALVRAIMTASRQRARNIEDLVTDFMGRLSSLQTASELALGDTASALRLKTLVVSELEPFVGRRSENWCDGPDVMLSERAGPILSLVVHELTMNAVKHGALSSESGWVEVEWRPETNGRLSITWTEEGGPEVSEPEGSGFGSKLIRSSLKSYLGGSTEIEFRPSGMIATLTIGAEHWRHAAPQDAVAAPEASPPMTEWVRRPLEGLTALVVEDNPVIALDYNEMLQRLGAQFVDQCGDLGSLEDILSRSLPDMVLLDLELSDGTTHRVASSLARTDVMVVAATGHSSRQRAALPPGIPILQKPFSEPALIAALRSLMD